MPELHLPHDGWRLSLLRAAPDTPAAIAAALPVPATVPGTVHTDLLAAGLIDEPCEGRVEATLGWIGRCAWRYEGSFPVEAAPPGERLELVCHGLDTVAVVAVDGRVLGHTRNMHRTHRFDVTGLAPGDHTLTIDFLPADEEAQRLREQLGDLPCSYTHPYNFIRKMACNFGWDWGPDLTTAGSWRPIGLHRWSVARLAAVRPQLTVEGRTGEVRIDVELDRAGDAPLRLVAEIAGRHVTTEVPAGADRARLDCTVPDVRRWWPHDLGGQDRYELTVRLLDGDTVLDTWRRSVGFRAVRLDTGTDAGGSRFSLVVNDTPVLVRGVNWIPDDPFPHRVDRDRLRRRLTQARDAGANLIRVWGGGVFGGDDLYDLCDELGLLVWQDFLFACAAYPEEPELAGEVAAEATEAVTRLMPYPSLVLWIGCNENIWAQRDWGWEPGTRGRSWGLGYYLDLLPRIVAELDPTRPYWPGSPYSGAGQHPNDPDHGTTHLWAVWNELDYEHYRDSVPRLVGEFGFQGPATYATLRDALPGEPLHPHSPALVAHQKAEHGMAKLDRSLAHHFGVPDGFDDWHFLASVNQARAIELGITHFRSHRPRCQGTVLWQLNDCWPAISWSVVDSQERRKPAWYALRRAYAPRLVTLQPRDGRPALVAVNDTATPWSATVRLTRRRLDDGAVLAERTVTVVVAPRGAAVRPLDASLSEPAAPSAELLVASAPDATRALWFFARDRELRYPRARFTATAEAVPGGYRVTVAAQTLLRDLTLLADRVDPTATVDDALLTVLPGESVAITLSTAARFDPDLLLDPSVLRCVNDRPLGGDLAGVVDGSDSTVG
ncbi:glycoside hydrolase family 2 protein [Dactylosporangium siamense]|uniref:beta-mannosidase n=1 Tax=Dactylosporangium siamense TaxID=685454 RepID=A0A919PPY7_9ACTN|nr:glycoside hydrolase family 2 protein [Dactylosporangium siamense]GIG47999.1 beta-mannosidase [Dactylosporangium siamense]